LATLFPPELVSALDGQTGTGPGDGPPPDREHAETVEKEHGRLEVRRLTATREIVPYLAWPGLAQVCRIERTRERAGKTSCEVVYAITSLTREQAGPAALLALARQHWAVENSLHWRRDVTLNEDYSRVRSGAAPQALAALRNTVLRLVRSLPGPLTAIRETFAENRRDAITLAKNGFL
jgi:predicted transposase YbfD/YdcC